MTPDLAERLEELGIALPVLPPPRFAYLSAVRSDDLAFFSGRTTLVDGHVAHPGRLGAELTVETGRLAARIAAVNTLAAVEQEAGLENVAQIVKLTGFVAATPEFRDHPMVVDAASTLLVDVLGAVGRHARSAIGVASLPGGSAVEIEVIVRLVGQQ